MVYFPSCNFSIANKETAKKLLKYLTENKGMPKAGCCRTDKKDYSGETGLYFCQACREVLEKKYTLENLYVYLSKDEEFPWPDHSGMKVVIQDCWRDREHMEIMSAVRVMLSKMNIEWEETEESFEKSVFCGNLHFEPHKPENIELMASYPTLEIWQMPEEVQKQLMSEQVEKFGGKAVVTYCNRCTKLLAENGADVSHILDLAFSGV